ncbi:hypothetical protein BC829DRAFT_283368 [Chytridium lagenaria]|nr:hypothetical protein BC829DRAFT_283368 [Chytridium lagenaria]
MQTKVKDPAKTTKKNSILAKELLNKPFPRHPLRLQPLCPPSRPNRKPNIPLMSTKPMSTPSSVSLSSSSSPYPPSSTGPPYKSASKAQPSQADISKPQHMFPLNPRARPKAFHQPPQTQKRPRNQSRIQVGKQRAYHLSPLGYCRERSQDSYPHVTALHQFHALKFLSRSQHHLLKILQPPLHLRQKRHRQ